MGIIVIVVIVMYIALGFGGYWRALSLCKNNFETLSVENFKFYIILNWAYYAYMVGKMRTTIENNKADIDIADVFVKCFRDKHRLGARIFVTYLLNPEEK